MKKSCKLVGVKTVLFFKNSFLLHINSMHLNLMLSYVYYKANFTHSQILASFFYLFQVLYVYPRAEVRMVCIFTLCCIKHARPYLTSRYLGFKEFTFFNYCFFKNPDFENMSNFHISRDMTMLKNLQ